MSNAFRGTLAEYIVALDLGVAHGVCNDWAPYDLDVEGLKIEVKSSAYIQSWAQERLSTPVFSIRQARAWDPTSNQLLPDTRRHSDHYVFALLHCKQQALLDPLDLAQWTFYTLPTAKIDTELGAQKTVRVSTVLRLGAEALRFGEIREALGLSRKDEPL